MSVAARIDSLVSRHAALDTQINGEKTRPRPDEELLHKLKIENLHVKEEIERLRAGVQPA